MSKQLAKGLRGKTENELKFEISNLKRKIDSSMKTPLQSSCDNTLGREYTIQDSMARILAGSNVCASIYKTNQNLLSVSNNTVTNNTKDVDPYTNKCIELLNRNDSGLFDALLLEVAQSGTDVYISKYQKMVGSRLSNTIRSNKALLDELKDKELDFLHTRFTEQTSSATETIKKAQKYVLTKDKKKLLQQKIIESSKQENKYSIQLKTAQKNVVSLTAIDKLKGEIAKVKKQNDDLQREKNHADKSEALVRSEMAKYKILENNYTKERGEITQKYTKLELMINDMKSVSLEKIKFIYSFVEECKARNAETDSIPKYFIDLSKPHMDVEKVCTYLDNNKGMSFRFVPNPEGIHAEMVHLNSIILEIKRIFELHQGQPKQIQKELDIIEKYVGISKLGCGMCKLAFSLTNYIAENSSVDFTLVTRGTSGKVYTWPIPQFIIKDKFLSDQISKKIATSIKEILSDSKNLTTLRSDRADDSGYSGEEDEFFSVNVAHDSKHDGGYTSHSKVFPPKLSYLHEQKYSGDKEEHNIGKLSLETKEKDLEGSEGNIDFLNYESQVTTTSSLKAQDEQALNNFEKIIKPFLEKIENIVEEMALSKKNRQEIDQSIDTLKSSIEKFSNIITAKDSICETIRAKVEELSRKQIINIEDISKLSRDIELNTKHIVNKQVQIAQLYCVNEITYDNELLNHPEMFNKLASIYGANKVLDLSTQMPSVLLHEAIQEQNLGLLGSILSLD